MKTLVVFVAGALSLATAFGSDPYAEERFKAKYGRYTPAEEARRESLKKAAKAKSTEAQGEAAMCNMPGCCESKKAATKAHISAKDTHAEAVFRAKFRRPSPMKEARIAEAERQANDRVLAAALAMCDRSCCDTGE